MDKTELIESLQGISGGAYLNMVIPAGDKVFQVLIAELKAQRWGNSDGQRVHTVIVFELVRDIRAIFTTAYWNDAVERAIS